jgi:hypothetical protein
VLPTPLLVLPTPIPVLPAPFSVLPTLIFVLPTPIPVLPAPLSTLPTPIFALLAPSSMPPTPILPPPMLFSRRELAHHKLTPFFFIFLSPFSSSASYSSLHALSSSPIPFFTASGVPPSFLAGLRTPVGH